ncbi:hypothetical protein HanPSC8_Chr11g0487211 [Helianthus annuus]|nr:hypothetical protein HanPSC8_Chr11g0487211 [Helianthus annuus]
MHEITSITQLIANIFIINHTYTSSWSIYLLHNTTAHRNLFSIYMYVSHPLF